MGLFDAARTRMRGLFRRRRIERELDAELTFHLEQQIAENQAAGMPPDAARFREPFRRDSARKSHC